MVRRAEGVVERALDDEILVYDLHSGEVHCLAGVAARVWGGLSEPHTAVELAAAAGVSPAEAQAALEQLASLGLLAASLPHVSRRQLLRGAVVGGGALVALPAVQTVLAPGALAACSTGGVRQLPTTLADQWTATRTAGASTTPPNGLGGFTYVYGTTGVSGAAPPSTPFSLWQSTVPRRWYATASGGQLRAGDLTRSNPNFGLRSRGGGSGVGVRYTVPAGSTTATLSFLFSPVGGATYYSKNGGAAAVAGASGTLQVACNTGAVDVHFYVTGNPASSVPLTVSVSYA